MRDLGDTDLTSEQMVELFRSPNIAVEHGAFRVLPDFTLADDLSEYITGAPKISYNSNAQVSATLNLIMSSASPMQVGDFILPWCRLTDSLTGLSNFFPMFVFTLQSPTYNLASVENTAYVGYEPTALLNRPLTHSVRVSDTDSITDTVVQLILEVIPEAQVRVDTPEDDTVTSALAIPLQSVTYLEAINTLLSAIGYDNLHTDFVGVFRLVPFVPPQDKTPEWLFDADDILGPIGPQRKVKQDIWSVPNRWVFLLTESQKAGVDEFFVEGVNQFTYEDHDEKSPTSITNRGVVLPKTISSPANSYETMVSAAYRQIVADMAPAETMSFKTHIYPMAFRDDVVLYRDSKLLEIPPGITPWRSGLVTKWRLILDGSDDMDWDLQTATLAE